jgi:hypothetical protein
VSNRIQSADPQGLEASIEHLLACAARSLRYLERWREASQPHDGRPVVFVGTQPIEFLAEEMLLKHLEIKDPDGQGELQHPEFAPKRARQLLAQIASLPEEIRTSEPMRFAASKLAGAVAKVERHHKAERAKKEPLERSWDLWLIAPSRTATHIGSY